MLKKFLPIARFCMAPKPSQASTPTRNPNISLDP